MQNYSRMKRHTIRPSRTIGQIGEIKVESVKTQVESEAVFQPILEVGSLLLAHDDVFGQGGFHFHF